MTNIRGSLPIRLGTRHHHNARIILHIEGAGSVEDNPQFLGNLDHLGAVHALPMGPLDELGRGFEDILIRIPSQHGQRHNATIPRLTVGEQFDHREFRPH